MPFPPYHFIFLVCINVHFLRVIGMKICMVCSKSSCTRCCDDYKEALELKLFHCDWLVVLVYEAIDSGGQFLCRWVSWGLF